MRLLAIATCCLCSGQAVLACTPSETVRDTVSRGQHCAVNYAWRNKAPVGSFPAENLGNGVVKQVIRTGVCDQGEMIVVYFDCKAGRGAWLGGSMDSVPALQPKPALAGDFVPPVLAEGIAGGFIRTQEASFAPDYDVRAIHDRTKELPWVTDKGQLAQSRIAVDDGGFDLKCGCDLFYDGHQ